MNIITHNFRSRNREREAERLTVPTMIRLGYPLPDLDSLREAVCRRCDGAGQIPYEIDYDEDGHTDLIACEPGCDGGSNFHEHQFGACYRCHGMGLRS